MNLLLDRRADAGVSNDMRKQFVTLTVAGPHEPLESELVRVLLAGMRGVETIEVDAECERVWVFGDGTVEPEDLVDVLAWWGYGAHVLNHQLHLPE